MARLVIFDVDGTLTSTTAVDAECYVQALTEELGARIDAEWSRYRHVTDSGIAAEAYERVRRRTPSDADLARLRDRFLELFSAVITADPARCKEVPGAAKLMSRLREVRGVQIALATGAWKESAQLKLRHCQIPVDGLAFASASDSISRETILVLAAQRALELAGLTSFESVTYVGDGPWDVAAARSLGYRFVGVAHDTPADTLVTAGASVIFEDFTDADLITRSVLHDSGEDRDARRTDDGQF
jgi:phosphoglycolate phosphatase-like HAD superfamily hydrolase